MEKMSLVAQRSGSAVTIAPYNPEWVAQFEAEQNRLRTALGAEVAIAHVGSTAIAGMDAKPIIDVLVGHRGDEARCLAALAELGYVEEGARDSHRWLCWPVPERRAFVVHLVPFEGEVWVARLAFRDRLGSSGALRSAYLALKRGLAARYAGDLGAYTAGKADFVREVVRGALSQRSSENATALNTPDTPGLTEEA